MELQFRPLGPWAAARLAELHRDPFLPVWSEQSFRELLGMSLHHGLAAVDEAEIAGFLIWRELGEEAEILTLVVEVSYRRKGVARQLIEQIAEVSSQSGVRRLFLEVAADNGIARQLYERQGFLPVSVRKCYYRRAAEAVDAIILQKTLNSSR